MSESLNKSLAQTIGEMKTAGTLKQFRYIDSPMDTEVEMEGLGKILVLSSNNYLGLANHPQVIKAGKDALDKYGAGTASVRFICGTFSIHRQIEEAIAKLHRCQAALTYVSCWNANTGTVPVLTGPEDAIISDALNHASLIDACRLSKANRSIYKHSDMADLEARLKEASGCRRILVLTDGVFSMEGDVAKLSEIIGLTKKYGATLLVDDSHGVGVMGEHGRGTAEFCGVEGKVDIITGTMGKALGGAAGGYVAASSEVIEILKQASRPQLFSNALPATVAASALKAIKILEAEPERVARQLELVRRLRAGLKARGFNPVDGPSAIVPIIVGETAFAIKMSGELLKEGIFVTGFGFPVVPEGTARIRIQVSAALTEAQIDRALDAFERVGKKLGVV
jgi:glycine C-acetyltransferase